MPFIRRGIMDTLSGYSDEALRMLQKSALDEGKADEAARYGREIESRSGGLDMSQEARMARAAEQGFGERQWYRGTTHDYDAEDVSKTTPESHLGRGVYISSSADDVARHYASLEGPDISNKIQRQAEILADEWGSDYDDPEVVAEATRLVAGDSAPRTMRLLARDENIVDISPDSPTMLEGRFYPDPNDYLDEAGGDYDVALELADEAAADFEPEGQLWDIVESLRRQGDEYGFDPEEAVASILEEAVDGEMSANRLDKILRADEQISYAEGDSGELMSNEVIRQAFEDAGFRGIEMDANQAGWNMDIEPGTRHRNMFFADDVRSEFARFDPENIGNKNLLGRATPGGMAAAGATAGAAALASQEAEAAPMGTLADGIKMATRQAYHGSPHDFDKFSLAKIGTGEGAQAYGHGLYFSSKEDIARFYRDKLSGMVDKYGSPDLSRRVTKVGDAKAADLGQDVWEIADQLAARNISIDDYISSLKAKRAASQNSAQIKVMDDLIGQAEDAAPSLRGKEVRFEYPGKLYTVEIPDESLMLDWDKPLSEQPAGRKIMDEYIAERTKIAREDLAVWEAPDFDLDPESTLPQLARERIAMVEADAPGLTGREVYEWLSARDGAEGASRWLREHDIPGITYIGESSDERNFVVFDDEHINMIQKGLVDPKLLAPMAAGAATIGYATSEFAAAESSLNATEDDLRASSERFKALRKGKRAQRLSQELERVLAPVAGPAKALMDATEVMLVGVAGGIPGYLSELTGYVRGQDLEEAKAGGEALAGKLTGTMAEALGEDWDPQNPYLQGLAKAMEQGEKEFQDAYRMLGVENSVMKKGWDQLPERAQRIIKGMADLAL